jgi:hypothetical protein
VRPRGLSLKSWCRLLVNSCRGSQSVAPQHVFLCVADHYEPDWGDASDEVRSERVARWVHAYPRLLAGIRDSAGRSPQHTFFYPLEEYRPRLLDQLADLCRAGWGDVEVHLHHDRDTSAHLRARLEWFTKTLHDTHGLLRRDAQGQIRYGFIHGNWALDNSHPDRRWCGVNDELTVLRETGCYADFTMPAAPNPAQTRTINSIYYAVDDPARPKSHDVGVPARVGHQPPTDGLLMIQGPLALDWTARKYGLFPRLENASVHAHRFLTMDRLPLWMKAAVHVAGRPDWTFVKLHTHGAKPVNYEAVLGPSMRVFHESLAQRAQADGFRYYYVTAHEMAALIHAAEAGISDPLAVLAHTATVSAAKR